MKVLHTHTVPSQFQPNRFIDYAQKVFGPETSNSAVKKAIKRKEILLNGLPSESGRWIRSGDVISWVKPDNIKSGPKFNTKLRVHYEDSYMAAVEKPAGLLTSGNSFRTLENTLAINLAQSNEEDALDKMHAVHRLDKDTHGLILVAKTASAERILRKKFANREIKKKYVALVSGGPIRSFGKINVDIQNKIATTYFKVIQSESSIQEGSVSLLEIRLITGREHQIRRHLSAIGLPILGDSLYNDPNENHLSKGLFLSANHLELNHPIKGGRLIISCRFPLKFDHHLDNFAKPKPEFE